MPCLCGKKVDRFEAHKVLCIVCKQYVHGNCHNINIAEVEFLKNFKCNECLQFRRRSLSASTFFVENVDAAELVGVSEMLGTQIVSVADNNEVPCTDADNNTVPRAGDRADKHKSIRGSPRSSLDTNAVSISLVDVYRELMLLKTGNENLTNLVSALRSDNVKLLDKVANLEIVVSELKSSIPITSSKVDGVSIISTTNRNKESELSWSDVITANLLALTAVDLNTPMSKNATVKPKPKTVGSIVLKTKTSNNNVNNQTEATSGDKMNVCEIDDVFKIVESSKSRRRKFNNVVVGSSTSSELDVVVPKKWLHLSSFKASVTADAIIKYVNKYSGVAVDSLVCHSLVKKDVSCESLKKINFKLGVSADFYDKLLCPDLWPTEVKVRPFRFRPKINNNV